MRPSGVVVGIVVLILWFLGATLIAAPSNIINTIIPSSLHLGSNVIELIAISTFIVAAIVVAAYTATSKDETEKSGATVSGPATPS